MVGAIALTCVGAIPLSVGAIGLTFVGAIRLPVGAACSLALACVPVLTVLRTLDCSQGVQDEQHASAHGYDRPERDTRCCQQTKTSSGDPDCSRLAALRLGLRCGDVVCAKRLLDLYLFTVCVNTDEALGMKLPSPA